MFTKQDDVSVKPTLLKIFIFLVHSLVLLVISTPQTNRQTYSFFGETIPYFKQGSRVVIKNILSQLVCRKKKLNTFPHE